MVLSQDLHNCLEKAKEIAKKKQVHYVGTEHIILSIINYSDSPVAEEIIKLSKKTKASINRLFDELLVPVKKIPKNKKYEPEISPILNKALEEAMGVCEDLGFTYILTEALVFTILNFNEKSIGTRLVVNICGDTNEIIQYIGEMLDIRTDDLIPKSREKGPTVLLEKYGRDLTRLASENKLDPVVGREKEISRVIQILSRRTKNNPCLVGEPGVGKTAIAEGLAQKIVNGDVPIKLYNMKVFAVDISSMVAGAKYRGEFENRLKGLVKEIEDRDDILIFIDELHTLIGAGAAEGSLDAANILKPSLSRGEIKVLGATTFDEYRKYIEKDTALARRFQSVEVSEPTRDETIKILQELKKLYEKFHGVVIENEAIEASVDLSIRYMTEKFLPDKAIDVLEEASSKVQLENETIDGKDLAFQNRLREERQEIIKKRDEALVHREFDRAKFFQKEIEKHDSIISKIGNLVHSKRRPIVTVDDINETVSKIAKIPVKELTVSESKKLAKLGSTLHKHVIGQEEAVEAVALAVQRGRVGLKDPNRPVGSFLFLGPTGVGKTQLSKALALCVFGSENKLIRIDMSEYMEAHQASKLIGSPPGYVGYNDAGQLSEKVRRNPYSVVLFDEIEKAHPDVLNILLQILDDGHITDGKGKKIDFKNTIIIMTSNVGAKNIVEPKKLGFIKADTPDKDYSEMKNNVMDELKRAFRPEFLNRIDETIVFHGLTKKDVTEIIKLLITQLSARLKDQMDITIKVNKASIDFLVNKYYDPKYGARPLKRAIQKEIENPLSLKILNGEIKRGLIINCKLNKDKLDFQPITSKK